MVLLHNYNTLPAIKVHCFAHSLNLCLQDAASNGNFTINPLTPDAAYMRHRVCYCLTPNDAYMHADSTGRVRSREIPFVNGDVIASKYVNLSTISRDLPMPFVSYYTMSNVYGYNKDGYSRLLNGTSGSVIN